jgi:hypothetical protein
MKRIIHVAGLGRHRASQIVGAWERVTEIWPALQNLFLEGFHHDAPGIAVPLNTASFKLVPETSVTVFSQYHYNHNQTHSYDIVGSRWLLMPVAGAQAVGGLSTIVIHDPSMTCMIGSRAVTAALGRSVSSAVECRPR